METHNKIAMVGLIFTIIVAMPFLTGYASLPDILNMNSNSQINPPSATTAAPPTSTPPTPTPDPTQQPTPAVPSPSPSNSDGSSVSFSTPTPPPTPTPISAIDLPFDVIATNSFVITTTSHTYKVVLPEAGRLTISASNGNTNGARALVMRLNDSDGKQVGYASSTSMPSTLYPYIRVDLDAGTYYLVAAKPNNLGTTGTYNVQATFSPFEK